MKHYSNLYRSEIEGFKDLMIAFQKGELTVPQFKGKSGGFGVYAQRGGEKFMIRLRTPSGIVSHEHMDLVQKYMHQYKLDSVHLTTRQTFQLHDLTADETCEIMNDAINYDLFTRGGGGNYPRNVALSPMSGVEKGEAFDVTNAALQLDEYFIENASTYHLPRKLKVSFSNGANDTACSTINDVGFVAVVKDNKPYFRVFLAGGMGKDPAVAIPYNQLIEPWEAIYYVEAFIRLFMELGDYQNRGKARSRYIPRKVGEDAFLSCFERHLELVKRELKFDKVEAKIDECKDWKAPVLNTRNLFAQKQEGLYTVILHTRFGKISTADYDALVDFIHRTAKANEASEKGPELRISMEEALYIRNLTLDQANECLELFKDINQTTAVTMSFSCIGVPTCQIGIQNSRNLLLHILETVEKNDLPENLLPEIHISGCGNSCTRHQMAELGFAGKKQSVHGNLYDVFELYAGGHISLDDSHMGKCYGTVIAENIPGLILELGEKLLDLEVCFSKFLEEHPLEFEELIGKFLVVKE